MTKIIVIAGPTGIGKSNLSLQLAQRLHAPILSADSRQVYREMSIGTAKPTKEELALADHYFINSHSIHDAITAGQYEMQARSILEDLSLNHDYIIITGGTGFYIKALMEGIDVKAPSNSSLRAELDHKLHTLGITSLVAHLKSIAPNKLEFIDIDNPRRLIRAIEIASYEKQNPPKKDKKQWNYPSFKICLTSDRPWLYNRINIRVDQMIEQGLIEEARSLHKFAHLPTLDTVGYRELFRFFDGEISQKEAIELIKRNSRRYAKRQLTWYRNQGQWRFLQVDQNIDLVQEILEITS